jgi:hypothetical protein
MVVVGTHQAADVPQQRAYLSGRHVRGSPAVKLLLYYNEAESWLAGTPDSCQR